MGSAVDPAAAGPPRALGSDEIARWIRASSAWWHGRTVLDVRSGDHGPPSDHVLGSAWVPLGAEIDPAPFLMPPRGRALLALGAPARAEEIARVLGGRGWPCSWNANPLHPDWIVPAPPRGALWSVDPFLPEVLASMPAVRPVRVLDLGAGNGREAVYLAREGHEVVALDRLPDALDLAVRRAAHHGVRLETAVGRAEDPSVLLGRRFDLVLAFRLVPRDEGEAFRRWVRPGGVGVLAAYGRAEGSPELPSEFARGPRRNSHRLSVAEVKEYFGPGWSELIPARTREHEGALWTLVAARRQGSPDPPLQ